MAQPQNTPHDEPEDRRMSFYGHLDELRVRIVRILWVLIVAGSIVYLYAAEPILAFLRKPLFEALPPEQHKLYFTSLFENFFVHLKISAVGAFFAMAPYVFWEFWRFIAPGLYDKERKLVVPFVLGATICFLGGAAFAYYVLFPVGFKFFVTYGGPTDMALLTMDSYYTTCLKLMLLFGAAFELPVVIVFLGFLGIVDAPVLREKRRFAILAITIVSALVAPPDAISMLMLMAPLILLYEASIWIVAALGRKRAREAESSTAVVDPLMGRSELPPDAP